VELAIIAAALIVAVAIMFVGTRRNYQPRRYRPAGQPARPPAPAASAPLKLPDAGPDVITYRLPRALPTPNRAWRTTGSRR
jgi:hypothetical protein